MANDKKNTEKKPENQKPGNNNKDLKPKFSPYWIYAMIIIAFLGINYFSSGGWAEPAKTTPAEFQEFLKNGDIERVVIVNKNKARVFLTEEGKARDVHIKKVGNQPMSSNVPAYQFEFGDLQNFENEIRRIKEEYNLSTSVVY